MSQFEERHAEAKKRYEIVYVDDIHMLAGLFAAQCTTLRSFVVVDRMDRLACLVERTPYGGIFLKQDDALPFEPNKWSPFTVMIAFDSATCTGIIRQ